MKLKRFVWLIYRWTLVAPLVDVLGARHECWNAFSGWLRGGHWLWIMLIEQHHLYWLATPTRGKLLSNDRYHNGRVTDIDSRLEIVGRFREGFFKTFLPGTKNQFVRLAREVRSAIGPIMRSDLQISFLISHSLFGLFSLPDDPDNFMYALAIGPSWRSLHVPKQ